MQMLGIENVGLCGGLGMGLGGEDLFDCGANVVRLNTAADYLNKILYRSRFPVSQ